LGDVGEAIEFYEQQLVIVREIGDRRGEGNALGNLGIAHYSLGDARQALEFHEQRLAIAREIGNRRGEGNALLNSAVALHTLGNRPEAIARAEAALAIYEAVESPTAAKVRAALAEWRGEG
jgi:tetratricopeptide (TPR) repeat protein